MTALRINFILPKANMSGGVKSNRLIAEALVRRGHTVRLAFLDVQKPWPRITQPRKIVRRAWREMQTRGRQRHHLEHSTATLIPVRGERIDSVHLPDADVSIATWWETAEWIEHWPASKGAKAYFIRHFETHGGNVERVRATYRLPYLKLVIARWLQRMMAEDFGDPGAVLIPNGVDWAQFDSSPRAKSPRPTVGMLYGPVEWKGALTAFDAFRRVRETMPEVRLVAFGSHPLRDGHAPPAGLEYHLRPSQAEIPRLYQSCDCWVVPSTLEGFGMPGLEAAASHCPIVSTRCGGPEDYVEEGVNGHLVPAGDSEAMAAAITRVLRLDNSAWTAMSEASYTIARRFDWDESAALLEQAFIDHLQRRSAPTQRIAAE